MGRGGSSQHNDSLIITHRTPSCITAMIQDPEFCDWDFGNMVHHHEIDTVGFYTYIVPCYSFSNNTFLCVGVHNDSIKMRFSLILPTDFNYQTYYDQYKDAFVNAYSYNGEEEFFNGVLDVHHNTFTFYYVNENMFQDENTDFPTFWKWKDMNPCQRFFTGFEIAWIAPTIFLGPVGAIAADLITSFTMDMIKEYACIDY